MLLLVLGTIQQQWLLPGDGGIRKQVASKTGCAFARAQRLPPWSRTPLASWCGQVHATARGKAGGLEEKRRRSGGGGEGEAKPVPNYSTSHGCVLQFMGSADHTCLAREGPGSAPAAQTPSALGQPARSAACYSSTVTTQLLLFRNNDGYVVTAQLLLFRNNNGYNLEWWHQKQFGS